MTEYGSIIIFDFNFPLYFLTFILLDGCHAMQCHCRQSYIKPFEDVTRWLLDANCVAWLWCDCDGSPSLCNCWVQFHWRLLLLLLLLLFSSSSTPTLFLFLPLFETKQHNNTLRDELWRLLMIFTFQWAWVPEFKSRLVFFVI